MKRVWSMTVTALLAGATLALGAMTSGCKPMDDADPARKALPSASAVAIKLPGAQARLAGDSMDGVSHHVAAVLGQTAEFYGFTRQITRDLNGGAAWVLLLVKAITDYPVTSTDGATWIWGPWNGNALDPASYRLTVTEQASGDFAWSLEGRRKADGDVAYLPVVSGVATPGAVENHGSGTFTMNFENAELLDPVGNDAEGVLDITYDLESAPATVVMDYAKTEPTPEGGTADVTFHYEYLENADGSGDFQFTLHGDLDDNGSAWEDTEVRSRWLSTGAGRSDVRIQGGDLAALVVTGSECWDPSFARVFWNDSQGWQATEGDVAACPFADAQYPNP